MVKIRQKRILVIGAGAIGGVIAGFLARNGYNVVLVTKYNDLADRISNVGITISGIRGSFTYPIPAVAKMEQVEGLFDFIFLATKANDMLEPARKAVKLLTQNGKVISIQNGIVEEELSKNVGSDKIIGCVVGWGATLVKPGAMEMTSDGEFVIGGLTDNPMPELLDLKEILNRFLKTTVVDNILDHLYSKLIVNMCVTTLGAISAYSVGQMLIRHKYRLLIIYIAREALDVAQAMGIKVPLYANQLDYYRLAKKDAFLMSIVKHIGMETFGWKYRKLKSSSLQSLERGRPTEIEFLNEYVVKKGMEYNVETPLNSLLVRYVREIENGERNIDPKNFDEDEFKPFYSSILYAF